VKLACIDIGTNSVLLLVVERNPSGALTPIQERATITRLGEGVDRARILAPNAIARTNACLDDYATSIKHLNVERVVVVATSAMRDAAGGDAIHRHVRERLGVNLRVISGDEEARLTFAGALSGLGIDSCREPVVVFDVGGGSTEVVHGRTSRGGPDVSFAKSLDVGSVRLTERYPTSDPPEKAELETLREAAQDAFRELPSLPSPYDPVGIAGTVTTLAAVNMRLSPYDGARVHGHTLNRTDLCQIIDRLASVPLASRRQIPGLDPKRADVIVAGAFLVLALVQKLQAQAFRVSDRGVRWGLAESLTEADW
jgi:exopolyphosphatase/guanosine-5'-triphosphate,3'-diphosphate pyrophosphatase